MSDFDRYRRCSPLETLQLSSFDRCIPLGSMPYSMRTDMRANPLRQPNRGLPTPDLQEGGSKRQRISVACARCRKRKIRCSGDPGDGSGCHNCRSAGADISQCQFNRVGSGPIQGLSVLTYPSGLSNQNIPMASLYHGYPEDTTYPKYHSARGYPASQSTVYGDESPTESYGYQATTAMPHSDTYGGQLTHDVLRNWAGTMRQNMGNNNSGSHYLEHEAPPVSYSGLPIPQLNSTAARQPVNTSDNMSVFNLNSLQASLGSPPTHAASLPQSLENRHLPMPNTARMPLSPGQAYGGMRGRQPSAVSCNGLPNYSKAAMGWNQDHREQHTSNGMIFNRRDSKNQHQHQLLSDGMHHSHQHSGHGDTIPSSYGYVPNPDPVAGPATGYAPSQDLGDSSVKYGPPINPHLHPGNYKPHVSVGVGIGDSGISRSDSTTSLSYYPSSGAQYRRQSAYGGIDRHPDASARLVSGNQYQPLETPASPVGEGESDVKKEASEGGNGRAEAEEEARTASTAQVEAGVRSRNSAGSLKESKFISS